ncbi:MAG: hypothetical protein V1926_04160 [Candidatus Peregrinibacteria bacterium]
MTSKDFSRLSARERKTFFLKVARMANEMQRSFVSESKTCRSAVKKAKTR